MAGTVIVGDGGEVTSVEKRWEQIKIWDVGFQSKLLRVVTIV
jgi:hypothetical protein